MSAEPTLNVTVAQIEDALLKGQTVPDFAREWSEPPANVLAVFRRLQQEGRLPRNGPAQVATTPRPLTSVPTQAAAPPVSALVGAASRSASKRTQALGKKLDDLAGVLRQRLADERDAAVKAEKENAERVAARAEVERLEAALRAAREKAGVSRSKRSASREDKPLSDAQQQQIAAMREKNKNSDPCANGCGYVASTKAGKKAHERGSKCPNGGAA